ncbi:hypothetical protein EON81_04525 [bacterium]|nr:MAG: hypothetical protein EON81_04525 [bacterium]
MAALVSFAVLGMAWIFWEYWLYRPSVRLSLLLTPALGYLGFRFASGKRAALIRSVALVYSVPALIILGGISALAQLINPIYRRDIDSAVSPDGRYLAALVSDDGFWQLELRPRKFDLVNMLDWPTSVVPYHTENTSDILWQAPDQLTVGIGADAKSPVRNTEWKGVHIHFVKRPAVVSTD